MASRPQIAPQDASRYRVTARAGGKWSEQHGIPQSANPYLDDECRRAWDDGWRKSRAKRNA